MKFLVLANWAKQLSFTFPIGILTAGLSCELIRESWQHQIRVTLHERHGVWNYQQLEWFFWHFGQTNTKQSVHACVTDPLWGELIGDRWIPLTNDHWRGKLLHVMTSWWQMVVEMKLRGEHVHLRRWVKWGMLTSGLYVDHYWYPVIWPSLCNSCEDRLPIDFIFKWGVVTWLKDRVPG